MTNVARKPLEDWQMQDAARLRKLFVARATLNQSDFGAEYELGSQGAVWQYLNGHIPLNLAAALKFLRRIAKSPLAFFAR